MFESQHQVQEDFDDLLNAFSKCETDWRGYELELRPGELFNFRAQSTIYAVVREAVRRFVDGALLLDAVPRRGHPRGSQGASKSPS